jgi:hypothetical protein
VDRRIRIDDVSASACSRGADRLGAGIVKTRPWIDDFIRRTTCNLDKG